MNSIYTANQSRLLLKFLAENNLSKSGFWVIEQILTASMGRDKLIARAYLMSVTGGEELVSNLESIANALETLTKDEFVWIVDDNALKMIETFLSQFPDLIGPSDGLPELGDIDFTLKGAALAMRLYEYVFRPIERMEIACYFETPATKPAIIGQSKDSVLSLANAVLNDEARHINLDKSQIHAIGSWADRWWRIFPSGYSLIL